MSNDSGRKIKIFALIIVILTAVSLGVFSLIKENINEEEIPPQGFTITYGEGETISFSGEIEREAVEKFFSEKGIKLPPILNVLPEKFEAVCEAEIRLKEGEELTIKLLRASFNGISIPQKLLSDIGEIKLDFKRSLVYNGKKKGCFTNGFSY